MKASALVFLALILLAHEVALGETFTLTTHMSDDFSFIGPDGTKNPTLEVKEGDVVEVVLHNGDGAPHVLAIPDLDIKTERVDTIGEKTVVKFVVKKGEFKYFCPLPGHRRLGMEGRIVCRHQ